MADAKPKDTATATEKTDETVIPRDVDRVAMVSLRADGTPDQTPGHEVIGDEPDPRTGEK